MMSVQPASCMPTKFGMENSLLCALTVTPTAELTPTISPCCTLCARTRFSSTLSSMVLPSISRSSPAFCSSCSAFSAVRLTTFGTTVLSSSGKSLTPLLKSIGISRIAAAISTTAAAGIAIFAQSGKPLPAFALMGTSRSLVSSLINVSISEVRIGTAGAAALISAFSFDLSIFTPQADGFLRISLCLR